MKGILKNTLGRGLLPWFAALGLQMVVAQMQVFLRWGGDLGILVWSVLRLADSPLQQWDLRTAGAVTRTGASRAGSKGASPFLPPLSTSSAHACAHVHVCQLYQTRRTDGLRDS